MSEAAASEGSNESVASDNSIAPEGGLVGNSNTVGQTSEEQMGTAQDDYSYVPEKFRGEDGEPNWQQMSESYSNLEKKLGADDRITEAGQYEYELADDDRVNMDVYDQFKEQAVEHGMSNSQFEFMMNNFESALDSWQDQADAQVMTAERGHEALSEVWGDNTDEYIGVADKALTAFAPEGLDVSSIANDPNVIQLLYAIGEQMGEDYGPAATQSAQMSTIDEQELADLRGRDDYWRNPEVQRKVADYYAKYDG